MTKHGLSTNTLYYRWNAMKQRCLNTKHREFKYYGARGIKVCERWLESFENFYEDMSPSFKQGLQLDRADNDKGYSPDNCRWVTASQNMKNRKIASEHQSDVDYVSYNKRRNKWYVEFDSKDAAEKAVSYASNITLSCCN